MAECDDTSKVNITPFLAIRLMLDRAATVDSAVELLQEYDIDFSSGTYHFFISDRSFKSAVIEYIDGKMSVTYNVPGTVYQVCTNKMEDKTVRSAERDYSNRFKENSHYLEFDKTLSGMTERGLGIDRTYAGLMLNDIAKPMASTDEYHYGTTMYGTQYTVLYDHSKLQMRLIIENDSKAQTYTYDLQ